MVQRTQGNTYVCQLIKGYDDSGKDGGQEATGVTEDEIAGCH